MRGATLLLLLSNRTYQNISIHAPHARSDRMFATHPQFSYISIHAPHARSDLSRWLASLRSIKFQSTLLMRGATSSLPQKCFKVDNFNPRSSCEERPHFLHISDKAHLFQSTLLMRGATWVWNKSLSHESIFQSTLLMRGATVSILGIDLPDFIIYFSRTYPFSPKMPTSRHLSCKLHFLCDGTSHFGDL